MDLKEAAAFLQVNSGKIFDPELAGIFLELLRGTDIFIRVPGKKGEG